MLLRELQQSFQAHVLGPDTTILPHIADTPPLAPALRLGVYREAYVARLRAALKTNYVQLHQVLGDDVFADLAAGFIAAQPSHTASIRWFGLRLPQYLQETSPYSEQPVLAELARFEWALGECFDAADAAPLARDHLSGLDPAAWAELRFTFHPAVRTLSLQWNAVEVWKALQDGAPSPSPRRSESMTTWLLWRQDNQNRFRSISAAETVALAWGMDGASFGEICEHLAGCMPVDDVPLQAATLLSHWLDSQMLTA